MGETGEMIASCLVRGLSNSYGIDLAYSHAGRHAPVEARLEPVEDLLGPAEVDGLALREDEHLVEELVHLI